MEEIFFSGWEGVLRVATSTICAYILVVVMLRISGKRTLAKMNAFDFIVTIALGSILGSVILNKTTPIIEGLTAIAILISLQYFITFISVRSNFFKQIISSTPTLLFYDGKILDAALKQQRVSRSEINKSIREAGYSGFEKISAIILESTGDITVISKETLSSKEAMTDIQSLK